MVRSLLFLLVVLSAPLTACGGRERDQQLAQCVDIYRSMYIGGHVRDCLVQRFGWSAEDAASAERKHLSNVHPDSAAQADSGRVGDSSDH
ncbi:MAG TPA: hypothetical protein VMY76_09545 [Gemmatimonadales bacterium]|nr:hypothetical protein [Gemmatimonadales bacterium]